MGSSDDRFRELFFEEAREHLISLEEGLMDLERRQGDRAHLDKTFRAAHTIKGAAAMVGLEPIARFTHGIEAVLEQIRTGSLAVDSDIITTLLESRDHLAAMVEGYAAGSPVPGSGDLSQRLSDLLRVTPPGPATTPSRPAPEAGGPSRPEPGSVAGRPAPAIPAQTDLPLGPPQPDAPAATPNEATAAREDVAGAPSSSASASASESRAPGTGPIKPRPRASRAKQKEGGEPKARPRQSKSRAMDKADPTGPAGAGPSAAASERSLQPDSPSSSYQIKLSPGPETLRRGVNPLGVLDELRELGESTLTTDPQAVPLLDELDPERCYLSWTITVRTDAEPERLRDVFLFVSEDSNVHVERRLVDGTLVPVPLDSDAQQPSIIPAAADFLAPSLASGAGSIAAPALAGRLAAAGPSTFNGARTVAGGPAAAAGPSRPGAQVGGLSPFPGARPHARIRVDALQLDDLVGLAGELAVLSDNLQGLREISGLVPWLHALEALQRVSRQIRDTTLDLRMVPVDELFSRFPRVVRDLADRSGKEIELRIIGQETRLDRTIVERLGDPMVHLIRNAVDHGLETPQERLAQGKPRMGRITLIAGHEGDRVAIRVEDDGRGLDREKIIKKGTARGLIPAGVSPDDPRVVSLIFEPGFSTRDDVSEMSGRGVGLDVVRDSVRGLRGSLSVESTPGKGTSFIFRLPLTLALIDGLLVETAGGRFVVPLAQVEECVSLGGTSPALAKERPCVSVRGELVPMISLRSLFRSDGPLPARQELLLTRHAGQRVGVAVDRLVGRVQAVIQSLGEGLHGLSRFSGATILGDGTVSLILDLSAVVTESLVATHSVHITPSGGVRAESLR
ncbi:MAG: chemotaxis protein CheW [Isosphaeraceae bacterium]